MLLQWNRNDRNARGRGAVSSVLLFVPRLLKLGCCAAFHLPPADALAASVPTFGRSQPRAATETTGNVDERG